MKSILLTGSRGFIASGLDLKADGMDLKNEPYDPQQDVIAYEAVKNYDVVIHTAALTSVTESMEKPYDYIWTNVIGTMNMLKQNPEAYFIYLSTCAVYGEGMGHTLNSRLKPDSVYATTKLSGEFLVKNLAKSWCILRLTNVIGPGERGEPNVYQVFEKEETLPIYGDGLQTRDFIHVDSVRAVIKRAVEHEWSGTYNIGSGKAKTVLEVAKEFNKPMKFLPERPGEIKHFGISDAVNNFT